MRFICYYVHGFDCFIVLISFSSNLRWVDMVNMALRLWSWQKPPKGHLNVKTVACHSRISQLWRQDDRHCESLHQETHALYCDEVQAHPCSNISRRTHYYKSPFQYNDRLPVILIINKKDYIISIMGISKLVKQHLDINMAPTITQL